MAVGAFNVIHRFSCLGFQIGTQCIVTVRRKKSPIYGYLTTSALIKNECQGPLCSLRYLKINTWENMLSYYFITLIGLILVMQTLQNGEMRQPNVVSVSSISSLTLYELYNPGKLLKLSESLFLSFLNWTNSSIYSTKLRVR
jgi:hypothetical protein